MPNQMLQGMVAGCAMELVICTLCVITFGNITGLAPVFSEYLQSSSEASAISEASSEVSRQYGRTASIVCAVTNLVRLLLVVRIVYLPENLFNAQLWDKRIFIQLLLSSYLIAFVGYAFLLNSAVITDCSISSAPKSIYTHTEGWGKFAEGWGKIAAYNETFVDCHIGCNSTLLGHIPNADQIPALALFTCLFRFGPPLIFGFLFIKGVLLYGELETMKSVKVLFQLALLDVADVAAFSTINFEAPGHIFFEHNKKIVFNLMRVFLVCCGCTVCLEVFFWHHGSALPIPKTVFSCYTDQSHEMRVTSGYQCAAPSFPSLLVLLRCRGR